MLLRRRDPVCPALLVAAAVLLPACRNEVPTVRTGESDHFRLHVDTTLSIFNLLACGLYIHAALGPAYGSEGVSRIVKAAVLAVATAGVFVGYRFAVFLITLYTT